MLGISYTAFFTVNPKKDNWFHEKKIMFNYSCSSVSHNIYDTCAESIGGSRGCR